MCFCLNTIKKQHNIKEEQHGDTHTHYGCELGDLHFAIHPTSNFGEEACGTGAVKLAFTVFDMDGFVERMAAKGVDLLYPPKNVGFAMMTAIRDPDGNLIEFTQLSDGWFKHLKKRRNEGVDVIERWEATRTQA